MAFRKKFTPVTPVKTPLPLYDRRTDSFPLCLYGSLFPNIGCHLLIGNIIWPDYKSIVISIWAVSTIIALYGMKKEGMI